MLGIYRVQSVAEIPILRLSTWNKSRDLDNIRETLETQQVKIYFGAVVLAALIAWLVPGTTALESTFNASRADK